MTLPDKSPKVTISTTDLKEVLPSKFQVGFDSCFEVTLETPTGNKVCLTDKELAEGCLSETCIDLSMTKLTRVQQRLFCSKLQGYRWGASTLYEIVMTIGSKLRTVEADALGFSYKVTMDKFMQPIPFDFSVHGNKLDRHDTITVMDATEKKIFDRFYILLPAPRSGIKGIVIGQNLYETDSFTVLTQVAAAKKFLTMPAVQAAEVKKPLLKAVKLKSEPKEKLLKVVQEPAKIEMLDLETPDPPVNMPEVRPLVEKPEELKPALLPNLSFFAKFLVKLFGKEQYRKKYTLP